MSGCYRNALSGDRSAVRSHVLHTRSAPSPSYKLTYFLITSSIARSAKQRYLSLAEMMDKISCEDTSIKKIIRLGRRPEQADAAARPIKLVMETEAHKEKVLESAKNLRNIKEGGFAKVFIHQDLTP